MEERFCRVITGCYLNPWISVVKIFEHFHMFWRLVLPFLIECQFGSNSHAPTRFCPGTSYYMGEPAPLKRVDPVWKNEPARQTNPTCFQHASCNWIIFLANSTKKPGCVIKIDFRLNKPAPSQPASCNQPLNLQIFVCLYTSF